MPRDSKKTHRPSAFTLVELLTVVFIISLLIAILIPSLGAARNAAKKSSSQQTLKAINAGLEMFRNDQGKDFAQTNGYPPSFVHPPILDGNNVIFSQAQGIQGQFPYIDGFPKATGAHFLPAMLIGVDAQGYVPRDNVPTDRRDKPWNWYASATNNDGPISHRAPLYLDTNGLRLVKTGELPGRPPENVTTFFPEWDGTAPNTQQELPVIADGFDQPILYYAANKFGRPSNLVAAKRDPTNAYAGGEQEKGPAYYFHEDNEAFTGRLTGFDPPSGIFGWDFGNSGGKHPLGVAGEAKTADELIDIASHPEAKNTFARYVLDRKVAKSLNTGQAIPAGTPLRPVNPETYLLITPGVDGIYGTTDDISNLPSFDE